MHQSVHTYSWSPSSIANGAMYACMVIDTTSREKIFELSAFDKQTILEFVPAFRIRAVILHPTSRTINLTVSIMDT